MKLLHIVGARPNFMKAAPVLEAVRKFPEVEQVLVHTGQHFDERMSDIFFSQLGLPKPDHFLGIHGGSHSQMIARIMLSVEEVLEREQPDRLMVYGDVNSTLAAALVAQKMGISVAHVEAGLRSFDETMPEEHNRRETDRIADMLFIPSEDALENLETEGLLTARQVHFVGNVMIDSLVRCLPHARKPEGLSLPEQYALVTLHRPANVDDPGKLSALLQVLVELSDRLPVIFPIHPRTRQKLESASIDFQQHARIQFVDPLGYLEFLWCLKHATLVLTDSGGIQEETTYLRVPCFTARDNTERPITLEEGTNVLVGADAAGLKAALDGLPEREARWAKMEAPKYWDGHAAERIAEAVLGR